MERGAVKRRSPRMNNGMKLALGGVCALGVICLASSVGTSNISAAQAARIIASKIARLQLGGIDERTAAIVWNLRLPRALLAFVAGGCFAASGAVFQSVLRNQLASPYIVGVSSGASLGAALVMLSGLSFPLAGAFTLPAAGFAFGLLTVLAVVALAEKLDPALSNNTVILFGMVFSLFVNAALTTLLALFREELKSLLVWQMGSFSLKGWAHVRLLLPFCAVGMFGVMRYAKEMDILTFGEEQAKSAGVETERVKKLLFLYGAVLTGGAVALSGAVGFVDLISPHAARKLVGSTHRAVVPMSFLVGGCLLTASDVAARTVVSPSELPVGAITALVGAPFFVAVYFGKR
jgi:iron complex transport system permease protein